MTNISHDLCNDSSLISDLKLILNQFLICHLICKHKSCPLSRTITSYVIGATKEQFARHGIPVVVQSDRGPQFKAYELKVFALTCGFVHTFSSTYNSQLKGKAESAVKIAKRLLKMCPDPYMALLEWEILPQRVWGQAQIRGFSQGEHGVAW